MVSRDDDSVRGDDCVFVDFDGMDVVDSAVDWFDSQRLAVRPFDTGARCDNRDDDDVRQFVVGHSRSLHNFCRYCFRVLVLLELWNGGLGWMVLEPVDWKPARIGTFLRRVAVGQRLAIIGRSCDVWIPVQSNQIAPIDFLGSSNPVCRVGGCGGRSGFGNISTIRARTIERHLWLWRFGGVTPIVAFEFPHYLPVRF